MVGAVALRKSRLTVCCALLLVPALLLPIPAQGTQINGQGQAAASSGEGVTQPMLPLFQQQEGFPCAFVLQRLDDKPLVVGGSVLDSTGKPLAGSHVAVVAELPNSILPLIPPHVLGEATTGANGAFQATMPGVPLHQLAELWAVARHDGHGFSLQTLDVAAQHHDLTFRLPKELRVLGRVLDPTGRPAAGVDISVLHFVELWPDRMPADPYRTEAPFWPSSARAQAWPPAATTDGQGRFVLEELPCTPGVKLRLWLGIDDLRYAPLQVQRVVATGAPEELVLALSESRIIEGVVIGKDTKKPIADAWLSVALTDFSTSGDQQMFGAKVKADETGRFRARCRPGKFLAIYVYPPPATPYPGWVEPSTPWKTGELRREVTVEVPKGVLVRGKVVEVASGAPVAGATVEYQIRSRKNPYFDDEFANLVYWGAEYYRAVTAVDGTFELGAMPGTGFLLVKAGTPDFISRYVGHGELQFDEPGGHWYCVEGLLKIDPEPEMESLEVTIPMRRGVTVRGHVVGPGGETIEKALLLTHTSTRYYFLPGPPIDLWARPVRKSHFELPGCDPSSPQRVYFFDAEHQWGATVMLDASKAAGEPVTIRLAPCGSATACLINEQNEPLADRPFGRQAFDPMIMMRLVLVEAPANKRYGPPDINAVAWWMENLDPERYQGLRTDTEGFVTFPSLIPLAPYKLMILNRVRTFEPAEERSLIVKAGESLDLGDIVVSTRE
ncbi:MAG: carboxypeptidase-like regulatory domain-containing protein [Planctomycetota bacterium]